MEKRKSPWGPTLGALAVLGAGITGAYVGESQRHGVRVPIQTDVTGKALYASKSTEVEIPENDYFMSVADKIDAMYVEPGQDHRKMAVGAVRGMVNYLADPLANFMNPQQFSAYLRAQQGQYEGIGTGSTPEAARRNCCFFGKRVIVEEGVAYSPVARRWFAVIRYR